MAALISCFQPAHLQGPHDRVRLPGGERVQGEEAHQALPRGGQRAQRRGRHPHAGGASKVDEHALRTCGVEGEAHQLATGTEPPAAGGGWHGHVRGARHGSA